ncbi:hypothetical protein EYF80_040154 [Liparis tanakae]|uniref:Uncharacterized protein n=1 Tax=Liparis tanakae TaxID=230148 RepID=A0A4Z2G7U4_9TELE|nr:hypothetical protein EYF80_040154 [Liparis tanakae]
MQHNKRQRSLPRHLGSGLYAQQVVGTTEGTQLEFSAPWRTDGAPQPSSLQTTSASCWSKSSSYTEDHDWSDFTFSWPEHRLVPFTSLTDS